MMMLMIRMTMLSVSDDDHDQDDEVICLDLCTAASLLSSRRLL